MKNRDVWARLPRGPGTCLSRGCHNITTKPRSSDLPALSPQLWPLLQVISEPLAYGFSVLSPLSLSHNPLLFRSYLPKVLFLSGQPLPDTQSHIHRSHHHGCSPCPAFNPVPRRLSHFPGFLDLVPTLLLLPHALPPPALGKANTWSQSERQAWETMPARDRPLQGTVVVADTEVSPFPSPGKPHWGISASQPSLPEPAPPGVRPSP